MFIKSLPHHSEILTLHILRLFFPALLLLCFFFSGERLCLEMCDGSNFFCSNTQNSKLLQQQIILLLVFQPRFNAKCICVYIYILVNYSWGHSVIDWLLFALQWSHKLIPLNWLPLCCVPVSMTPCPTCEPSSCWPIRAEISQWS